ncbi:MAG: hypothetical protein IJ408_01505 [Clostridia bacterium]|nr:hypothetical protein [Clostridia bacterium]
MPVNIRSLKPKDVKGKKIHKFYLKRILIIGLCALVFLLLFTDSSIVLPFVLLFIPVIIISAVFSKTACILSEDRLYYFNATVFLKDVPTRTNGYVKYCEIDEIGSYGLDGKMERVVISGDKFKIIIKHTDNSLVRKVNQKRLRGQTEA